ncbi:MAG: UDP-N-acetylmuramate dehydrogenase [Acidimicrobiia bacterium]|nr:UDP-N-acetylmuramate dehydrogenase [Acidimicrobiia bacterium]
MTVWSKLENRGRIRTGVPLGPMTTYKLGGKARWYTEPDDPDALGIIVEALAAEPVPILILGQGSNLVVAESGFDGVVVKLGSGFRNMELDGGVLVTDGGVPLPRIARFALDRGYSGLEFAVGIPGSVGGAVHQNAGCFGVETVDRLLGAEVVDLLTGERRQCDVEALDMSYRHSAIGDSDLVVSARWSLTSGNVDEGRTTIRQITRWRRDHQPGGSYNAGSVFKNPPGEESAGAIIDRLGLKGFAVGGVSVSRKHANFFVASEDARPEDIKGLVKAVADRVAQETGIKLEPEIEFVGMDLREH